MDRLKLLDRQIKDQSDGRIPLVLTYHPALNRVYDILRDISIILLVGPERKKLFENKIFLSFRRAKNIKDKLVRAKLPNSDDGGLSVNGCYKCNGRKSCQICVLIKEGDSFENSDENRSFTIFSGRYNCNSENVVYLLQCECCRKCMWVALNPSFGRDLMFTNRILGHTQANVTRVHLTGAK